MATKAEILAYPVASRVRFAVTSDTQEFIVIPPGESGATATVLTKSLTNNYAGVGPPLLTDDSSLGYEPGSVWMDILGQEGYRCVNASIGAALWVESTFDGAEVAAMIAAVTDQLFDGSGGYVGYAALAYNAVGNPANFFTGTDYDSGALKVWGYTLDILFNGSGSAVNAALAYQADYATQDPDTFFGATARDADTLTVYGYPLDNFLTGNGAAYYAENGYVNPSNFFAGTDGAADTLTVGGNQLGFFMDNGDGRVNATYFKEGGYDGGTVTATYTVDLTLGSIHAITLTAGTACAVTLPPVVVGVSCTVEVKQAATPTGTCTFTGAAWIGNVTPSQTAIANRYDRYVFTANVAGTAWVGSAAQNSPS